MIRLFINGLAASAGGGLTYLRNVIPEFSSRGDASVSVLLHPQLRREFGNPPNISFVEAPASSGVFSRLLREQTAIPELIRRSGSEVLISAGNFALWNSPVPQILLSRNSLYVSADFMRDIRARGDYAIWGDTLVKGFLARQSILRANITVAPSEAFARELTLWSNTEVVAIHHGFSAETFTSDPTPLPAEVQAQLQDGDDALRLLFVSHYNYYRNFETLLRAMPILKRRLNGKRVRLFLTCRFNSRDNPGTYSAESASSLLDRLRGSTEVVELGSIPYSSLHHLYAACHIYVTCAYTESFAHPLVEAMSSGLPVVASDLPVHREICRDAGAYFHRFSPDGLAKTIARVHDDHDLASRMSQAGLLRAKDFSWKKHVASVLALAVGLVRRK